MINFKNTNSLIALLLLALVFTTSCVPNKKRVLFQHEDKDKKEFTYDIKLEPYRVKPGDVLYVSISSDNLMIPGAVIDYSASIEREMLQGNQNPMLLGTIIDEEGFLNVKNVGKVQVNGLTITEIKNKITEEARQKLVNPVVKVFLLSFYVTVMGEVRNPGQHLLYNETPILLDAIAKSGDFLNYANRGKVEILRIKDGKLHRVILDLTDEASITNPYLFLYPNDKIIVRPLRSRRFAPDNQGNAIFTIASLIVSTTTTFLLFFLRGN